MPMHILYTILSIICDLKTLQILQDALALTRPNEHSG